MRNGLLQAAGCVAVLLITASTLSARQRSGALDDAAINCRVLEVHASDRPAVVAVVFHHRDKQDQAAFGSLLQVHSGEKVQVQFEDGKWIEGTVARLKSCFGRGLLLLPAEAPPIKEREAFLLSFAPAAP